ncbi:hypothetical protein [uncultured Methanobrevibacter sp.]|uniref:hypothetical protein n=1 Tax=uncultured Methanobrevibacter sp. TaxID=253161 RepID=UPI0025DD99D1|nr:hypothetical protein [uncultured Methanobrevibacter sp.]
MTSEVLIMTPSAVAMAADSVVTVNGNKTYEGVNKLFMLSNNPPMGIMTYNNANFLTFPMETIIKDFRDKIFKKEFDTIHDFKKVFGEYLNDVCHGKDAITSYSIVDKFNSFIKQLNQDLDEIPNFIKHIMEETTNINNEKYEKLLFENKEFERIYDSKIQEVSENIICDDDDVDLVVLFKKLFIKRFVLDGFIGIVIAGFNRENLFPSYMHFKIIVLDGVKFIFDDCEEDCVGGETAVILKPFAQINAITNFLNGIDMSTNYLIASYFNKVIDEYSNNMEELIKANRKINGKDELDILSDLESLRQNNERIVLDFVGFIDNLKGKYSEPILQSIMSLPKDELANLSESLINITSLKVKVQDNLETVGGDVDVAIITKGDGFVWTKRKHYFEESLNPQFFNRKNLLNK